MLRARIGYWPTNHNDFRYSTEITLFLIAKPQVKEDVAVLDDSIERGKPAVMEKAASGAAETDA